MDNNQKEQMKKAIRDLASHTEKAASMAKDKISRQMEQENVKKAAGAAAKGAQTAAKGARKASVGITAFWKRLSRRGKIMVAVVAVLLVCGGVTGGKGMQAGGQTVTCIEDGEKILRKKYPEPQYAIYSGKSQMRKGFFDINVGECWEGQTHAGEKIDVFSYRIVVQTGPSVGTTGLILMAEDGRMLGQGDLFFSSDWIRLR